MKFYAVRNGRDSHVIVKTWSECKTLVHRYPKAEYKSFTTIEDAKKYLDTYIIKIDGRKLKQSDYLKLLASDGGYKVINKPNQSQAHKLIQFLLGNIDQPDYLFDFLEFEI